MAEGDRRATRVPISEKRNAQSLAKKRAVIPPKNPSRHIAGVDPDRQEHAGVQTSLLTGMVLPREVFDYLPKMEPLVKSGNSTGKLGVA